MGLTHVSVTVGNPANGRNNQGRLLVDSGAIYSAISGSVLRRLAGGSCDRCRCR
jgi:hypothetical protein